MYTVFSEKHRMRDSCTELYGGEFIPPFECPARADLVRDHIDEVGLGEVVHCRQHGLDPLLRIHPPDYVRFLETAYEEWLAAGFHGEAIASCWPARRMRDTPPAHIDGKLGYYAFAAETAIDEGTYEAARAAVDVALTGVDLLLRGERAAFALCRPPGHHAARDLYGGYCFFNNAAVAAQALRDRGMPRVAILDIDFHHGNGTQDVFYDRGDVLFVSIHGDPAQAFPYFSGFADETGRGGGEGTTVNLPLPPGADFGLWGEALEAALRRIADFRAEALVVSLGTDTYERDPIGFFGLRTEDFPIVGRRVAGLGLPTLFVMEGGYAIDELAENTVKVLLGFLDA